MPKTAGTDVGTEPGMKRFTWNNGLSIAFLFLFILSFCAQVWFGFKEHNEERRDEGGSALTFTTYISSGHFIEATFENWESEFLQMAVFVYLTVFLYQKGSSESKKFDGKDEVDKSPDPKRKNAPWPVRKGGFILKLYQNSLTLVLAFLFVFSFVLHFYGSLKDENEHHILKGLPEETASHYLASNRFWFESFQNWQSEFLSIFAIILLSVYLRQKGSSQSKPVDAPYYETGG